MEFRVLGPIEARLGGKSLPIGGPKPRTLLAVLAVHAGRVVSLAQLVDAIWGDEPPDQTRAAVYTYVSTLRRALGGDFITRSGGGYLLDAEDVDLRAFELGVETGRKALADSDLEGAATCFDRALALWRGPALGGTQGPWAENERSRLEELRLSVLEDRAAANLAIGNGEAEVAELSATVGEHPLRERLRGQLMLALHQAGRQADALACYRQGREVLLDELGVEPGQALKATHERILRAEPEPEQPRFALRPSQLPFDIADFTGRAKEVDELRTRLSDTENPARVCAVHGKPGAGKSTLAMHVAHRLRDDFPDGQLYATLRNARPAEVLAGFLRALGVPDTAVPAKQEERAQLYRSMLTDQRVLVVLDDAADEQQIRPLLPGGWTCAVLVTSRERLGALGGATQLDLHVLDQTEALDLLDRVIGDGRVAAEPAAAREIVQLCGRLPLAVRIAGARLAARPQWKLTRLVSRLGVQHRILQELTLGDLEVRGSLALSYDDLADMERTALRRLGLLDVSSFASWLVAPLLDCDPDAAEDIVERLVDAQLLDVDHGGLRYRIHDLTRVFARERGEAEETSDAVREATTRAAECWLGLIRRAGSRMPHATFDSADTAEPYLDERAVDELVADPETWFEAEQAGLVGFVERISELDMADAATRLAAELCSSRFAVRNLFSQWWRTHSAALAAARRANDQAGTARLLTGLGWLRYEQDRFDESADYFQQALVAYEHTLDLRGQAMTRLQLSTVQRERGNLSDARRSLDLVLEELRALDEPHAHAQAVHGLGRVLTEQGELDDALTTCEQALAEYEAIGDERGRAIALRSVGIVLRAAGRLDEAAVRCAQAVDLLRRSDDRLMSAYAVQALAKVRIRQGGGDVVRGDLLECLSVCHDMQDGFGQALVLRTLGELELAAGRPEAARGYLERSLDWWDALGLPVWRARTQRDLAATFAVLGLPELADGTWAQALDVFRKHGSREAREPRVDLKLRFQIS